MKVVLFSNTAWSVYNFRRGLIAALQASGYTVSVVVPPDMVHVRLLEALGCKVTQIPMDNMGVSVWRDGLFWLRYLHYFFVARPQLAILFTIKPVIYGATAAWLMGVRTICVITGLGTAFIRDDWLTRFVQFLYRVALIFPDCIFFLNKEDLKLFLSKRIVNISKGEVLGGEGINLDYYSGRYRNSDKECASRVQHLPGSGVNIQFFVNSPNMTRSVMSDRMVFLLVARMIRDKGVVEFVDAARLLKQRYPFARFQLLGFVGVSNPSAISQKEIDEWVASGVVEYLGETQDVRPFLEEADCIVLPSYREGVPRTLLEAAAMNRPIVATDVPGCRDAVGDGVNGFLCLPRDAQDLADKMERMILLSPSERAAMGQKGREKMALEFDERIVIERFLKTIAALPSATAKGLV